MSSLTSVIANSAMSLNPQKAKVEMDLKIILGSREGESALHEEIDKLTGHDQIKVKLLRNHKTITGCTLDVYNLKQ